MNDQASRLYGVKKPVTAVADNESSNRRVENGRQMRMISEALQGVIELPNESFTGLQPAGRSRRGIFGRISGELSRCHSRTGNSRSRGIKAEHLSAIGVRVLIDACLPVQLKAHLRPVEATTAREMGWQRLANGELLAAAQAEFDVFLTLDKAMPSQQNLGASRSRFWFCAPDRI